MYLMLRLQLYTNAAYTLKYQSTLLYMLYCIIKYDTNMITMRVHGTACALTHLNFMLRVPYHALVNYIENLTFSKVK